MKPVFRYWMIATLVIWILTLVTCKSSIEDDLTSRSKQSLSDSNSKWTTITATGRDLVLKGESLSDVESDSIIKDIELVNGVRVVENATTILPPLLDRARSALESSGSKWVAVEGNTDSLILRGEALTQEEIDTAVNSVNNLRGLVNLDNTITLLPPLPVRAKTKLEMDGINWIEVTGNDSELTLTGAALNLQEVEAAINNVSSLRGLKYLDNKLTLLAPLKDRARIALNDSGFDWVTVNGEDNHLTLTGEAVDQQTANEALASLNLLRGMERLTSKIKILTPLKDRARAILNDNNIKWADFKISNNDISLSGSTIDASIANQLVDQMRALAGVGQVSNKIRILNKLSIDDCQSSLNELLAGEKIEFDTGSATINSKSQLLLSKLANTSRQCPEATIVIMGHTDNTGKDELNVELSKKRAQAVVDNLIIKGVATTRLTAMGLGPWYPIESNDTEEGRQKNRRIEFKVN